MKVGLLLSGCGFYDGTEIAEAVLSALALERSGARVVYLAPETSQMHTVDHLTGSEVDGETRGVLAESARLARGRIRSLSEQWAGELGALIIPGGQGAVKNLMTNFARLGARREVVPQVRDLLADLTQRRAPIGTISLGRAVMQTFFDEPLSEDDMRLPATDVLVDDKRRLVFTPGFLTGASLPDVATGIDRMVQAVLRMPGRELHVIH
ncbi:MAG TPA: isoprenoid biosynthesis protein ElbB [Patescibacteria group bacterium]|jgi:enhancing lycopene biosynthesis protein 2|nr:isoprenoid biosynthesis protein ElbB [Patescibacteria group bacterium]